MLTGPSCRIQRETLEMVDGKPRAEMPKRKQHKGKATKEKQMEKVPDKEKNLKRYVNSKCPRMLNSCTQLAFRGDMSLNPEMTCGYINEEV